MSEFSALAGNEGCVACADERRGDMKKSIIALALLLCLGLSGCSAMLERSYEASAPHVDRPATAEDSSTLRVKDYRELVLAVLYLVSQGEETGVIQLYDYAGDVETDLAAACLEVATQDPLGAYYVDYIKHELVRVVSYDQATLSLYYRRTPEQVASMVNVTGTSAIRAELRQALGSFDQEVVLRVAYLAEDEDSLAELVRQTYYGTPATALGMPQVEINLYPDSGSQRVVEILLTYPESAEELRQKYEALDRRIEQLTLPGPGGPDRPADIQASVAVGVVEGLLEAATFDTEGDATPYAALVEGRANSEGMALAYSLCGKKIGLSCEIVEGALLVPAIPEEPASQGSEAPGAVELPRFWVSLRFSDGGTSYLDPSADTPLLSSAQEMFDAGYRWPGGPEEPETGEETASEEGPEREKTEEIQ